MKLTPLRPDFALSLSFDGIRLVQRSEGGWLSVGDVALDTPDLRGSLAELRFRAEALAHRSYTVKLVIPNDQIRYLELDIPAGDGDPDAAAIATALEGQTPYPVADLAYDWCVTMGKTRVAAVTRQTLEEAEAFARDHSFDPVCFVATPPDGTFDGEAFFGPTDPERPVERDSDAIKVTGVVGVPIPEPEPPETDAIPTFMRATAAPVPKFPDAPVASPPAEPEPVAVESPADTPVSEPKVAAAEKEIESQVASEPLDDVPPMPPSFQATKELVAKKPDTPKTASALAAEEPAPKPKSKPFLSFGAARAARREAEAPAADGDTSAVPAPAVSKAPAAPSGGFASIRALRANATPAPPAAPKLQGAARADASVSAPVIPIEPAPPSTAVPLDDVPPETATTIASGAIPEDVKQKGDGFFSRKLRAAASAVPGLGEAKAAPAPSLPAHAQSLPPEEDERQRMTVFGARETQQVGGKPKYLGLMLTVLLLVLLVGVAAMAAVFVDERISRFFGPQTDAPTATELAAEDIPRAVSPTAPAEEAPVIVASLGGTDLVPAAPEALSRPEPMPQLSPDEAASNYALTGIWQLAPDIPHEPLPVPLGDLYFPSLDPKVTEQDAVALPEFNIASQDAAPGMFASPAPAGTVFDLDERGFVRATPEGAISPDGVVVFSGRPTKIPPLREQSDEDAQAAPLDDATVAENARLAAFRPKFRPDGLVEGAEREQLGGRTRAEMAALRPKLRPTSLQQRAEAAAAAKAKEEAEAKAKLDEEAKEKELAEAAEKTEAENKAKIEAALKEEEKETPEAAPKVVSSSAMAVAASRVPKTRPRNFARIVARATPKEPAQKEPATRVVAQVKPKTVKPAAPSKNSVTRNATVKNAIKLNRINLIGVYGKPSARRALVRMANGRYKKVKVGDRLDGGRISAIGDGVLKYTKSGRSVTLKLPKT